MSKFANLDVQQQAIARNVKADFTSNDEMRTKKASMATTDYLRLRLREDRGDARVVFERLGSDLVNTVGEVADFLKAGDAHLSREGRVGTDKRAEKILVIRDAVGKSVGLGGVFARVDDVKFLGRKVGKQVSCLNPHAVAKEQGHMRVGHRECVAILGFCKAVKPIARGEIDVLAKAEMRADGLGKVGDFHRRGLLAFRVGEVKPAATCKNQHLAVREKVVHIVRNFGQPSVAGQADNRGGAVTLVVAVHVSRVGKAAFHAVIPLGGDAAE